MLLQLLLLQSSHHVHTDIRTDAMQHARWIREAIHIHLRARGVDLVVAVMMVVVA
jgi:hypothetical protein